MALQFHESPFHATHDDRTASKMAMKVDLSVMITTLIKRHEWTQHEAADRLGVQQSRISDLTNAKIEKFTIDAMMDMLDILGFQARLSIVSQQEASISISMVTTA